MAAARLRRRVAAIKVDPVDLRAAVGLALIGIGIGIYDLSTALIVVGAIVLGFAIYGSVLGR